MFRAVGEKNGKRMTVEYDNGKVTFDGEKDYLLEKEFFNELEYLPGIANYTPEDPRDPVNVYGGLEGFFDRYPESIETDEDISIPSVPEDLIV